MDHPTVKFTVLKGDEVVTSQECGFNATKTYDVPTMPSAEERASILGSSDNTELIEQQKYIEKLLDTLTNAGDQANSILTDVLAQHNATASKGPRPKDMEDYSSGEDAGDPNESTSKPEKWSAFSELPIRGQRCATRL